MVENKALEASLASLPEEPIPQYTLLNQSLMMQTGNPIYLNCLLLIASGFHKFI